MKARIVYHDSCLDTFWIFTPCLFPNTFFPSADRKELQLIICFRLSVFLMEHLKNRKLYYDDIAITRPGRPSSVKTHKIRTTQGKFAMKLHSKTE